MEPEGAYGKQPEAMKEMGGSLNRALFQGPPHAVRAYFEQHAARGSHMSRPDRLPLSSGLPSTGSPASRSGDGNMDGGIGWLDIYFRDTRFTVTSTDCRVETQLTATVKAGDASLPVRSTAGFSAAYDLAFDIKAVASPNAGSDLTLVIRT